MQVKQLVDFMQSLVNNDTKGATLILPHFVGKTFYETAMLLIDKINSIKEFDRQKYVTKIGELCNQIDALNKEIGKLKVSKIEDSNLFKSQIANKVKIYEYLEVGRFERAIQLCRQQNYIKTQNISRELAEYRWLKNKAKDPEYQKQNSKAEVQLSEIGKLFKRLLSDSQYYFKNTNQLLEGALLNIQAKDEIELKLPPQFFSQKCKLSFSVMNNYFHVLKEQITKNAQEYEQKNIILVKDAFKLIFGIQDFEERYYFSQYFDLFVNHVASLLHNTKIQHRQQLSSPSQAPQHDCGISKDDIKLLQNIKDIIIDSEVSRDGLMVEGDYEQAQTIMQYVKNMVHKLKQYEESIAIHKALLSDQATTQKQKDSKLLNIKEQILKRIQVYKLEGITQGFQGLQLFYQHVSAFLGGIDRKINSLSIKIDELQQKNRFMREEIEQEYRQKTQQMKTNENLVSHIKTLQIVVRSSIATSFIHQDSEMGQLQQKIQELAAENEKLNKALQENKTQTQLQRNRLEQKIIQFQKSKSQQILKLQRQLKRSEDEVKQLEDNLRKTNLILEQQMRYAEERKKQMEENMKQKGSSIDRMSSPQSSMQQQEERFLNQANFVPILNVAQIAKDQRIKELESIISQLKQTIFEKERQHIEQKIKEKNRFEQVITELKQENQALQLQVRQLQTRARAHRPQNMTNMHLFPYGSIFEETDHEQRQFLIDSLVSSIGPIKTTRLIFRADPYNKINFHKYIDRKRHVVLIFKTIYGKLIAAYSAEAFDPNRIVVGHGMIFSLWGRKVYTNRDKKAIGYDDYFLIVGNSELRIKTLEFKLFSNFGIANGYYDNRGEKVNQILGRDKDRQVQLSQYEFYALDLENP